jgi:glycosyltransferase involved in cell wall biosynthesis
VTVRVVHLINSLASIGGAERLILDLAAHMPVKPTTVVSWWRADNSLVEQDVRGDLDVIALHPFAFANLRRAIRALREADVVHVHLFPSLYLGALLNHRAAVYTEHNTWNRRRDVPWLRTLEKWIYRRYRKVIAVSEETAKSLCGWLQEKTPAGVEVIANGVNLDRFPLTPRPPPTPPYVLGMAARFAPEKDHETLLRALARLPEVYSLWLGGDGALRSRLEALARQIGVDRRVVFKGRVRDMESFFRSIHLYVQSSNIDGFSLVTAEAMACGLPALVTDIPGLRETVACPRLLSPHRDPEALAAQIRATVENGVRYAELSAHAVTRARQLDVRETARRYVAVYMAIDRS